MYVAREWVVDGTRVTLSTDVRWEVVPDEAIFRNQTGKRYGVEKIKARTIRESRTISVVRGKRIEAGADVGAPGTRRVTGRGNDRSNRIEIERPDDVNGINETVATEAARASVIPRANGIITEPGAAGKMQVKHRVIAQTADGRIDGTKQTGGAGKRPTALGRISERREDAGITTEETVVATIQVAIQIFRTAGVLTGIVVTAK
jgi:hypothetical protein